MAGAIAAGGWVSYDAFAAPRQQGQTIWIDPTVEGGILRLAIAEPDGVV